MASEISTEDLCTFCQERRKQYTCPRCNANYCSLKCYQSEQHLQCSELFYQKCVLDSMASTSGNSEEVKQKTVEAIKLFHENVSEDELDSDDDESDCASLSDRLAGVDLDDADQVWGKLTHDEQQAFKAFINLDDVSQFVPTWEPWWLRNNTVKVLEVDEYQQHKEECPQVTHIKEFVSITKTKPATCVLYNLVNIMAAYALTTRYFNGCHFEFVEEAVHTVVTLSAYLKCNINFESKLAAVEDVGQECSKAKWILVDTENINFMHDDVAALLDGPTKLDKKFYILSALSDLHKLFDAFLLKKGEKSLYLKNLDTNLIERKKVKLYVKKIEYLLSYTLEYYS